MDHLPAVVKLNCFTVRKFKPSKHVNRLNRLANAIDPRWVGFMQDLDEAVGESIASGTPSYFKSNWGFSFLYKHF